METHACSLRPLALRAIAHWKEHLPRKYAALKKAGTLNAEATRAAEMTQDEMVNLLHQGFPAEVAWEMVREMYICLPEEEGASEEAPPSDGYLLNVEINKIISEL